MLKCFSLAQADAHVTKELLEIDGFPIESLVEMLKPDEYQAALATDSVLKEFDRLLRVSYTAARENGFEFKKDTFGGYGLFYVGDEIISPKRAHPVKVLSSVLGYVEKIPKEALSSFKDISIFRKTESCSFDRVMLGTTRFANHSCNPNCRYTLKEVNSRRCIQLEVLKNISKNDEITVFYGPNFFGDGNQDCLCKHDSLHTQKLGSDVPSALQSRARLVLRTVSFRFKRRRVLKAKWRRTSPKSKTEMRNFHESSTSSECDSSESSISTVDFSIDNDKRCTEILISSPNREQDCVLPAFSVSTLNDCSSDSSSDFNHVSQSTQSCNFTQHNFLICVNEIISRHGTSDAQASDWLRLMKTAFPENKIPGFKSLKRNHLKHLNLASNCIELCGFGECATLDFLPDLCYVVKNNIAAISEYCATRDPRKDVVIPPTFGEENVMNISLAMNSDGVRIVNSKNRSLWPVWFSILNLPPILRCKFANIVLAKLWFGRGKPNWKIFFDKVRETLNQSVSMEFNDALRTIKFDTKFLVADLPAKAAILNMQQYNAYFGCSICLIESKAIGNGSRGLYYPNQRHKLRTKARHENYLDFIQREGLETFRGVKGPSAVSHIIDNLPLTAPIDYMHQVLLGITRSLLFSIKNHTKKANLEKINSATETIELTSDFKRSLRSIDELEYFKANELKVWLLYIGPVVLRGKHLQKFVREISSFELCNSSASLLERAYCFS